MVPHHKRSILKPVTIEEIHSVTHFKLNTALFLPSRADGYSLCVDFIYHWFMNKFYNKSKDKYFFNSINLDGHNPFKEMSRWTISDWLKRQKPSLTISPTFDIGFNREFIDDDFDGIMSYVNRTGDKCCFFRDPDNHINLGMVSRLNKTDFGFKIKVGQRPMQLEVYEHLLMTCRVGKSLTLYTDVDFLVPDKLISKLAKDLHFEQDERGFPAEPYKFLEYMNSHSTLTFLYKLRKVNRRVEFFVRVTDVMVHIRDIDISMDDGEKEGMTYTNFNIDLNLSVRMPCPKYFVYFSKDQFEQMVYRDDETNELIATDLVLTPIPPKNKNGWQIYLDGSFVSDNPDEPISVSLYDMFKTGDGVTNEIIETIEYCRQRRISPEIFMEIKVFNASYEKVFLYS